MAWRLSSVLFVVAGLLASPAVALADGPAVQITAPEEGAVVGGVTTIEVVSGEGTISVTFEWSTDGGETWMPIGADTDGSDGWTQPWDTAGYNGPAVIRATGSGPTGTGSATSAVTVDNTPPLVSLEARPGLISPNGDGRVDRTALGLTSSEPVSAALKVVDEHGTLIRQLATQFAAAKGLNLVSWNGLREGHPVADGRYRVMLGVRDPAGNTATDETWVTVDTTPPTVSIRSVGPEPADAGPIDVRSVLRDANGPLRTTVQLLDGAGVLRTVPTGPHASGPRSIRVALRRPDGGLLNPGLYWVRVAATDAAGNVGRSGTRSFRVIRPVQTTVWREVSGAGSRVALTFDDCNDHDAWNRILDIMQAAGLHTTFFCIGQRVAEYPDMARKTVALGDAVGNHTWDHADPTGLSETAMRDELARTAATWWQVARTTPVPYFRPPYGAYDAGTLAAAGSEGYLRTVLWDVDPQDWRRPGASAIVSDVLGATGPGDIVVLHVQSQTADALPDILAGLRSRGLRQVSLPELFAAAGLR
ncbi:MAG: polysaccharide deacetylase family protein [Actinomycetota bacterium]